MTLKYVYEEPEDRPIKLIMLGRGDGPRDVEIRRRFLLGVPYIEIREPYSLGVLIPTDTLDEFIQALRDIKDRGVAS